MGKGIIISSTSSKGGSGRTTTALVTAILSNPEYKNGTVTFLDLDEDN